MVGGYDEDGFGDCIKVLALQPERIGGGLCRTSPGRSCGSAVELRRQIFVLKYLSPAACDGEI